MNIRSLFNALLSMILPVIAAVGLTIYGGSHWRFLIMGAVWFACVFPGGKLIALLLTRFTPHGYGQDGLRNAGAVIGWFERTLVLFFYFGGSLEAIAFVVLAKSIYRFDDLRRDGEKPSADKNGNGKKNREGSVSKLSEYVILGSLMSYTMAILSGAFIDIVFQIFDLAQPFIINF